MMIESVYSNEGEAGIKGGPSGDLYVDIKLRKHPIFKREGSHLMCEVPLSFSKAALGRNHRSSNNRWGSKFINSN